MAVQEEAGAGPVSLWGPRTGSPMGWSQGHQPALGSSLAFCPALLCPPAPQVPLPDWYPGKPRGSVRGLRWWQRGWPRASPMACSHQMVAWPTLPTGFGGFRGCPVSRGAQRQLWVSASVGPPAWAQRSGLLPANPHLLARSPCSCLGPAGLVAEIPAAKGGCCPVTARGQVRGRQRQGHSSSSMPAD